jgi:S4 domain protein YaaA
MWYNVNVYLCHFAGGIRMLVKITTDYIELQQLLKLTDWISTGGEAKIAVKRLKIKLNGEPENRRGKKIYPGDVVEIQNKKYEVTK